MQTLKDRVAQIINAFVSNSSSGSKEKYNSRHIYFDLEELLENKIQKNQVLELYYFFLQNEKCLSQFRLRHTNFAEEIYYKVERIEKNINPIINPGVLSLFFSMSSYRDYTYQSYEAAIIKLDRAIDNAMKQSLTVPIFLIAMEEQWLNKIRVFSKMKREDYAKIIDEFVSLFYFSYTGITKRMNCSEQFAKIEFTDIKQGISHVVNQFIKITEIMVQQKKYQQKFYQNVINKFRQIIFSSDPNFQFGDSKIIIVLADYYNGEIVTFLEGIVENIELILASPVFIKKKIINLFLTVLETNDIDISIYDNSNLFLEKINQELNIDYSSNVQKSIVDAA